MTNMCVLLSDHINTSHCTVSARFPDIQRLLVNDSTKYQSESRNVNWNKLDTETYRSLVEERLSDNNCFYLKCDNLNLIVEDVTEILVTSAQECAPQRRIVKRRRRTNVWGPEIAAASKDSKSAFFKWKMAGKPVDPNNQTYTEMKLKKKKKKKKKKHDFFDQFRDSNQHHKDTSYTMKLCCVILT